VDLGCHHHGFYRNGYFWYCPAVPRSQTELTTPRSARDSIPEWTIDELARLAELPTRTLRDYQTLGILPPPRRDGRVGRYGTHHLRRLQLIARLRDRGYSLAGIGDLFGNWRAGADFAEVLGLEPDELVHVDEPGAPATLQQLAALLPAMVPEFLDDLIATGVIERCRPDAFCVPSPSLLHFTIDALDVGVTATDVLTLLSVIHASANAVAEEAVRQLQHLPVGADATKTLAFLQRSRGLLSHGIGRVTLHQIGRKLGVGDENDVGPVFERIVGRPGEGG
jgi:DNA-binding transcriptional MerR regulator